jgi:hypothetical protein
MPDDILPSTHVGREADLTA